MGLRKRGRVEAAAAPAAGRSWMAAGPVRLLAAGVLAAACAPGAAPDEGGGQAAGEPAPRKEIIQPEGVARLPVFSSAVRSGDLIFLSGAIGALPGVSPPHPGGGRDHPRDPSNHGQPGSRAGAVSEQGIVLASRASPQSGAEAGSLLNLRGAETSNLVGRDVE